MNVGEYIKFSNFALQNVTLGADLDLTAGESGM